MTRSEIERLMKRRLGREYVMEQQPNYTRFYGGPDGMVVAYFFSKRGEQITDIRSFEAVDAMEVSFYSAWSEQFSSEEREEIALLYQRTYALQCVTLECNLCFQYYLPQLIAADAKCARANIHWLLNELLQGPEKVQKLMKD